MTEGFTLNRTDLSVVAVLTVFSTSHDIAEPSDIPIFLSYAVMTVASRAS